MTNTSKLSFLPHFDLKQYVSHVEHYTLNRLLVNNLCCLFSIMDVVFTCDELLRMVSFLRLNFSGKTLFWVQTSYNFRTKAKAICKQRTVGITRKPLSEFAPLVNSN